MSKNLLTKLTAALALTTVLTTAPILNACSSVEENKLTSNLVTDSHTHMNYVAFIVPENSTKDYYISFIGHYDEKKIIGRYETTYENHKDYRVTYKVSKEDYKLVSDICSSSSIYVYQLSNEQIVVLNSIIDNYEPIEVVEIKADKNFTHTYLPENYRFKENIE